MTTPVIKIERLRAGSYAYFQIVGAEKPIECVWAVMSAWCGRYKIDWKTRKVMGYDCPHPSFDEPPYGYVALMEVGDTDTVERGRFNGVFIKKYDVAGEYATVEAEIDRMNELWDVLFAHAEIKVGNHVYVPDTDTRQYFEQHTCTAEKLDMTAKPLYFKIWLPVKRLR